LERLNAARPLRALPGPGRAAFAFPEAPVSGRDRQCPAGRPVPPARQGPWGGAVLLRPLDVDGDKVRYPSLCRPAGRHQAGCPSGQRERSVKPSASPTLVRIQDLPPPPETAPGLHICDLRLGLPPSRKSPAGSGDWRLSTKPRRNSVICHPSSSSRSASSMREFHSCSWPSMHPAYTRSRTATPCPARLAGRAR
jgi:hypothetical protein